MKKLIILFVSILVIALALIAYFQDKVTVVVPPDPDHQDKELIGTLFYSPNNTALMITNASYTLKNTSYKTNDKGEFKYSVGDSITFKLAGNTFTLPAQAKITLADLVKQNTLRQHNLAVLLANIDTDSKLKNGIQLDDTEGSIATVDLSKTREDFVLALYALLERYPKLPFSPTLGINLESPQAKADTVGQAMPFVDIFRTARPFTELSPKGVKYDDNGWPISIPAKSFARTKLLQGTLKDAIPNGNYTVLYEGKGRLSFGANSLQKITKIESGKIIIHLETKDASSNTEANSLSLVINQTDKSDPIRNIRIIMPGGICRDASQSADDPIDSLNTLDNPFLRVTNPSDCPANSKFTPFADLYLNNRNAIIFNPDYLQHLRNFRVIRMMNFMEASPSYHCQQLKKDEYQHCLNESISWENRAKMNDAVWGGSSRTAFALHKGVPVEVLIALANQLNRDPWFTIPHYADDDYVSRFADYTQQHLNKHLRPHIEYSNETWNPGFQSHYYVKQKGIDAGLDSVPTEYSFRTVRTASYFASLRYYVQRSLEIFEIWNTEFADENDRLVKIISGQQGDTILSEEMLKYNNASDKVDALAIAPYFFGCIDRSTTHCTVSSHVLSTVESVDDIFDIIDHGNLRIGGDPSALEGTLLKIEKQAKIAQEYGVQLMTYEGGQHLTIMGSMGKLDQKRKNELRGLFRDANRDPRMKERYLTLLKQWKAQHKEHDNVSLFTLYTMAQSYYDYGSWGMKEWLTQERGQAPKFDALMEFQEEAVIPWWN